MPRCAALVLAFGLVAAVRAVPVDEISARIVGDPLDEEHVSFAPADCTGSSTDCRMFELSGISPFEIPSGETGGWADLVMASLPESGVTPGGSLLSEDVGEMPENSHLVLVALDSDNSGRDSGATDGDKSWSID